MLIIARSRHLDQRADHPLPDLPQEAREPKNADSKETESLPEQVADRVTAKIGELEKALQETQRDRDYQKTRANEFEAKAKTIEDSRAQEQRAKEQKLSDPSSEYDQIKAERDNLRNERNKLVLERGNMRKERDEQNALAQGLEKQVAEFKKIVATSVCPLKLIDLAHN